MKKRILGRTNLQVTVIGIGGIPIQKINQNETNTMFREVHRQGINFIDTARGYGISETYIGNAIEGIREDFILASKSTMRTYEAMKSDIQVSLNNLKTDYIDLYQLHFVKDMDVYKEVMGENGAYRALVEAQAEGKIGFIGITAHMKEVLEVALETGKFDTIQFPYNPIEKQGVELFKRAKALNIGVIIMKPIAGGAFENGELSIKYILNNEDVTVVIPGMETSDLVKKNAEIGRRDFTLTRQEKTEIYDIVEGLGDTFCRRCGYCEPCPQEIVISAQFLLEAYLLRYDLKDWAKGRYASQSKDGRDCIECGICETKCPYNLPIRSMLKKVVTSFDS